LSEGNSNIIFAFADSPQQVAKVCKAITIFVVKQDGVLNGFGYAVGIFGSGFNDHIDMGFGIDLLQIIQRGEE
jgi:hypothetical protein